MYKIVSPSSFSYTDKIASQIKLPVSGKLRGNDLTEFIKRAGHSVADIVNQINWHPGEEPVHLIAMGSFEKYGSNKNGDAFKAAMLREYHHTFEKSAKFYRQHLNNNPHLSYGVVKRSFYNEPMGRVELFVGLNKTKEAAEKNNGYIADEELEKLANDQEIPVSMSIKVSHDVCSSCGNKAKSRREYCTGIEDGGHCKHGGLKKNIGKLCHDGHALCAFNPDGDFFDISHVDNQADRIAYVTGTLSKAASADIICGAQLADILGLNKMEYVDPETRGNLFLIDKLASIERKIEQENKPVIFDVAAGSILHPLNLPRMDKKAVLQTIDALSKYKTLLPLSDFINLTTRYSTIDKAASVARYLPGVYSRLANRLDTVSLIENNIYHPEAAFSGTEQRQFAVKAAKTHGLSLNKVMLNVAAVVSTNPLTTIKKASVDKGLDFNSEDSKIADSYAVYRLACLNNWEDSLKGDFDVVSEMVVRQHYIH